MSESKKEENKSGKIKTEDDIVKTDFFHKVWYSITKIEKYPEMAAQGIGKAIIYISIIMLILAGILSLGIVYEVYGLVQQGIEYIQKDFPEFSYKENKLDVNSEAITQENTLFGKTIIDTKTENEQKVNQYINDINQDGKGLIILGDKIILKILEQMGITEFNKQDVINYAHSGSIISLYASIFLTIFIYTFIMYLLTTLSNAVFLSLFGYITTWIARIRMRYVAIFNMAVYALTLSTILNIIYITINIFIDFNMQYFQVMYIAVAAIYLVAAIFMLKVDFTKKQEELIKIAEAQAIVRKELESKDEEERKKKDKKEEENKEKSNKKGNTGEDKKVTKNKEKSEPKENKKKTETEKENKNESKEAGKNNTTKRTTKKETDKKKEDSKKDDKDKKKEKDNDKDSDIGGEPEGA